jgi:hypothetical protein
MQWGLVAEGIVVAGWAGLTFFELTDIAVHPGEKMPGSRSARRAVFFYSARAVREIRCPSGNFKSPAAKCHNFILWNKVPGTFYCFHAKLNLFALTLNLFALTSQLLALTLELFALKLQLLALSFELFALASQLFALTFELFALKLQLLALSFELFTLTSQLFALKSQLLALTFELFALKLQLLALSFELFALTSKLLDLSSELFYSTTGHFYYRIIYVAPISPQVQMREKPGGKRDQSNKPIFRHNIFCHREEIFI